MTKRSKSTVQETDIVNRDADFEDAIEANVFSFEIPLIDGAPALANFSAPDAFTRFDDDGKLWIDCTDSATAEALRTALGV